MVLRGTTKRVKNTITDYDGTKYDPDDHDIDAFDPEGTEKISNITEAAVDTGIFTADVDIPLDGIIGRWTLLWKTTKATKDTRTVFAIYVFSKEEPTITEIRNQLSGITKEDVPDDTVDLQIYNALRVVDTEKDANATSQQRFDAILHLAAFLSYRNYATKLERGTGVLPPDVEEHLERYKTEAGRFLGYVRSDVRADPTIGLVTSLYDGDDLT